MFNQIQLSKTDRDYHRFIWEEKDYRWKRQPFGDKSAPDVSLFCLQYLAQEHAITDSRGAETILKNSYMDDILGSADSVEEAAETISEIDRILESGCFATKGWHSNAKEVETIEDEDGTGVLGVVWDKEADKLRVNEPDWGSIALTRRGLLSAISKVWDPLGVLCPLLVGPKVTLQNLSLRNASWDDIIEDLDVKEWLRYMQNLKEGMNVGLPRSISLGEDSVLHGFCNASDAAFGAVFWLVTEGTARFVAARTMVAPGNVNTVPRLELLAAQLASRMARTIRKALEDVRTVIWCNSEVVLRWIKVGAKGHKAFTAARLQEITEHAENLDLTFRHVPGALNPADALTKECVDATSLLDWLQGPAFLEKDESQWPEDSKTYSEKTLKEAPKEAKKVKPKRKVKKHKPKANTPTIEINKVKTSRNEQAKANKANGKDEWNNLLEEKKRNLTQKTGLEATWEDALAEVFKHAQVGLDKTDLVKDDKGIYRKRGRLENSDLPDHI